MPIFYDVTPSDVRNQTGDYAKAFESHERYHDEDTIKSWKAALREVGELSGWDIHSGTNRFFKKEGELVKEVTNVVLRELKKAYLIVTDYLVGVEHHVKEILRMSSADTNAVQIIGIHGMGGIGKTTLAKVIYNHLLPNFESYSFLADIRETSRSKGIKFLYERLISDILGKESANISNNDEGISIVRGRFSNKKVIILLDDVDKISQLEGFIGKRDFFGHGSRIIVTTRNKSILDTFKVDWYYDLGGLETHLALQLFSKHAFRKNNPPKEYSILSQRAVRIAAGLPLALEVFGSHLCGKSSKVWELILNKLEEVPHQEIRGKLSVTYEALDVQQKQIFLDIACFFIGEDYRIVIHFWEKSQYPEEAMELLQQMSLIKIQDDHILWMHDQLRDLGREIVREEHRELEKCSRLWNEKEATELFVKNEGGENIEGICLDIRGLSHYNYFLSSGKFAGLPNLRLLRVNCDYCPDTIWERWYSKVKSSEDRLPRPRGPFVFSKLRWFSWRWFPGMHKTRNISFENLAILDLQQSSITSSWGGWSGVKMAKNLKVLNLSYCDQLVKTPDLSCHPLLEQLILLGCEKLVEIDKSISMLQHLVIINLRACRRLKKLPEELSCVESLEELRIAESGIVEIPSWPLLRRLRVFYSFGCNYLEKVRSFDFAVNITELLLDESRITMLPGSIGKLVNLVKLSLRECRGIKTLPESIGDLVSLVTLDLNLSGIVELPNTIGNLRNLKTLMISGTSLRRLPTVIGMMENLMTVNARDCFELHDIPKLPESLIFLFVSGARTPRIPDLSNLINLKHLELRLEDVPVDPFEAGSSATPGWIGSFINLETLMLQSKCIISLHEDLSSWKNLKNLEVHSCPNLVEIPSIDMLENLETLSIIYCVNLQSLPDLSSLKKLKYLQVWSCPNLVEVPGIDMLENLEKLRIVDYAKLQSLPDLSNLKKLKDLQVWSFPNLVEIPGIDMLENLERLCIVDCAKLQSLPDLSSLKKLDDLYVLSCPNLVEIPGIDMLENLEKLSIEYLPGLSNLKKLHNLEVQSCPNLVEIPSINMLESLTKLSIKNCEKLQSLPDLSNLKKLNDLEVQSCPNLVEIPGIDMLESLKKLSIGNCEKLQSLPDLSNLKKLKDLAVKSCPNLVEITGRLESLSKLMLCDCQSLEKFPDIPNRKTMGCFNIEHCGKKDKSSLKLFTCT